MTNTEGSHTNPHPDPLPVYREREHTKEREDAKGASRLVWKRRLLIVAEVVLVLVIVGLLVLTWLPAYIGPRPGVMPSR